MPTKKKSAPALDGAGSVLSTVSGPSTDRMPSALGGKPADSTALLERATSTQKLAAEMPVNTTKKSEYGKASSKPPQGDTAEPTSDWAGASTTAEVIASDKTGNGQPPIGTNAANESLDRVRVDSTGQRLTTNQGVPVADNQNSLKAGIRGPTALEDFILREKITHFDHERIPERVVHARGSAAHGIFETYKSMSIFTRASLFAEAGKQTPVFVRFSTVAGERGSADTARDVRGFAVKFYTDEGNWDLVGNNIPVFFIQDAMKFPDLIHSVKPEQHHAMPQASSAHDTFWDFVSLTPESTHMLMWQMSDRAIPRSYRMMQGFGVHTFRLVNAKGASVFCKFHWNPVAGTHSLVWDEAAHLSGADPDFHRRDLWEAIEAGAYPEWELALQIFSEEQAEQFDFDVLDPTKLIPEELVPLTPVGKLTLNRNPDNFFAETEQVAFCTAHVVPGIDFSNDPLLQGRLFSYQDTQLTRLGGPNFHEIPINASIAPVHNNQRDGLHRQAIPRGRVAYEPNSLAGGCPFQAGTAGYTSFPQPVEGDKVRGKPEKFSEHFAQARLFWISQTPIEQAHIANAFRFELTRVQTVAVRERVLSMLANVDTELVARVADGLGLDVPDPMPRANSTPVAEPKPSPALSLTHRPGDIGIATRRVAILIDESANADRVRAIYASLLADGAVPRLVGSKLGPVSNDLQIEITLEAGPSVLYDGVIVLGGAENTTLARDANALDFLRLQYRHCKPVMVQKEAMALLQSAGIPVAKDSLDAGMIGLNNEKPDQALAAFKAALAAHRVFERENDPPVA
ncbi:MAG: catalase [Rudaea sp.]